MPTSDVPDAASARDRLSEELDQLRQQRSELATSMQDDERPGDGADQADTAERGSELAWVESRITEITDVLARDTGSGSAGSDDVVAVGRVVTLQFADGSRDSLLVGDIAFDAGQATVLTPDSPLGAAVLGRRVGDTVSYAAPDGPTQATVVELAAG